MKNDSEQKARAQALEQAILHIEKQFGAGSIMTLGKHQCTHNIDVISTGALSLDIALGIGGLPKGRIIEIYGPESSGKSTLATHIVANTQKAGGVAAYIDAEHALDPGYAANIGVNVNDLLISQPDCGEDALNIAEMLARSGAVDMIIVDSVAALVPKNELQGEIGDVHMGLQARMMSQALRKLTATLSKSNTCAVFINQIRDKIGVMFGSPETTTGGKALKFYASIRLDIRRIATLKGSDNQDLGNRTKVKVVKNKMAPPFQVAEFDIIFNRGISYEGSLIDKGVELEIIDKKGAWFSYQGERLGQGKESVRQELLSKPELCKRIEDQVYEKLGMKMSPEKKKEEKKEKASV